LRNPFDSDVVTNPEQAPLADVREIHSKAFDLVGGEAGGGKSEWLRAAVASLIAPP